MLTKEKLILLILMKLGWYKIENNLEILSELNIQVNFSEIWHF